MIQILVAESDEALNRLVCSYLSKGGYQPTACLNAQDALKQMREKRFDMILSGIMPAETDGFTFAEKVREIEAGIPVLFMTAREDPPEKRQDCRIGMDDYVVKPFDADLLLLRVDALLRRAETAGSQDLTVGNLKLNAEKRSAYIDGEELTLTGREFDLLFKLLSYPERAFTRSELTEKFWNSDSSTTSRTVDVYMAKLREKTARCTGFEIVTVLGLGYKAVLK